MLIVAGKDDEIFDVGSVRKKVENLDTFGAIIFE